MSEETYNKEVTTVEKTNTTTNKVVVVIQDKAVDQLSDIMEHLNLTKNTEAVRVCIAILHHQWFDKNDEV